MQYRQHVCYTFTFAFALSTTLSKEVKIVDTVLNVPTCLSINVFLLFMVYEYENCQLYCQY